MILLILKLKAKFVNELKKGKLLQFKLKKKKTFE